MNIYELLKQTVEKEASDLHLIAGMPPAIRIDIGVTPLSEPVLSAQDCKNLVYELLTDSQKKKFEENFELDIAIDIDNLCRFRINVYKQKGTVACAIRNLGQGIPTFESLGIPEIIKSFAYLKTGFVLLTGPTGSGKSTTLAALIDTINNERSEHIMIVEDPIEYVHQSKKSYITQREVGEYADTKSFASGLKYVLRQDPDVILIGEMRDYETIGTAITCAETGHLVFATLHTPSADQTIDRIIDVFPPYQQNQIRIQLSMTLKGIVSQTLLPKIDGGRTVACECLINNSAISNLIREQKTHQIYSAIQMGGKEGMCTLDDSLLNLHRQGIISYETAAPYIRSEATHKLFKE